MSIWNMLTGRPARTIAGGALVVDGLVGIDTPGRKRAGIFGSLLAAIIGIVFVAVGFYLHQQSQPYPDGTTVTGQVAAVHTSTDKKGKTAYTRVVEFAAANGQEIEFTEAGSSNTAAAAGDPVRVSYRAADPRDARIVGENTWVPLAIIGVGALVTLAGALTFVVRLISIVAGIVLLTKR